MNSIDFFLLQFKDQKNINIAKNLEVQLRCLKGPNGFNNLINQILHSESEKLNVDWVKPLLEKLKPYYKESNGKYSHPLNEFIEDTIKKLNGGRMLMMKKQFNLDNFTAEELEAPCMQWVKVMFERFEELNQAYPRVETIRILRIHPINKISDEVAFKLIDVFEKDNWFLGMDFSQFVDYYINSRARFEVENKKLLPEYAERMAETLKKWGSDGEQSSEAHLYWLSRNYEFHPLHNEFLKGFIKQVLRT